MPRPQMRTRSRKRIKMKLPSGETRLHYKQEGASLTKCCVCGQPLAGIPSFTRAKIRKINRSKKRIQRPYGGNLCHNCLKNALKQAARTV